MRTGSPCFAHGVAAGLPRHGLGLRGRADCFRGANRVAGAAFCSRTRASASFVARQHFRRAESPV